MSITRRLFGRRVLEAAASFGAASVGPGLVAFVAACGNGTQAGSDAGSLTSNDGGPMGGGLMSGGSTDGGPMDGGLGDAMVETPPGSQGQGSRRVAIIGSGYGSAVTALRLTEAGIPVTLFEMGRIWNKPGPDGRVFCSPFEPDGRAMWFKDGIEAVIKRFFGQFPFDLPTPQAAGVLDVRGPKSMRVAMGRGLGGGSLVNLAIYVQSTAKVLKRALPAVNANDMFNVWYPKAMATLGAEQLAEDLFQIAPHLYSRVGKAAAESIGIQGELTTSGYRNAYLRAEVEGRVPASASAGEGGFGNNYGKLSLDKTYFAEALATGLLTIHSLTEIRRITQEPNGDYRLKAKQIDTVGNVLAQRELTFSHVFVGAGSYGSSELMVRARETGDLPDLNDAVGTEWGPNSDIFVARLNRGLDGATGTVNNTVPGFQWRATDQKGDDFFSMVIPLPFGINTSTNICVTESREAGHFTYDAATDEAQLQWEDGQQDDAVSRVRHFFDRINVKTNSEYTPGWYDTDSEVGERSTYHPCGGMPLSRATDDYGRVRNYERLYVTDSSLLPVSIGGNPALTTAALAERNIDRIIAEDLGGPAPTSCLVQGCGSLRDETCPEPFNYFAVPVEQRNLFVLWDDSAEGSLTERLNADFTPWATERARNVALYVGTQQIAAYGEVRPQDVEAPAAWIVTSTDVDAAEVMMRLSGLVKKVAAYAVEAGNAATYERNWADGKKSPGAQLATMFRRSSSLSKEAFKEQWYCHATRQLLSKHPTWNYLRLFVKEALSADAPEIDGVALLHVEAAVSLESPQAYYLDPGQGKVDSDILWLSIADPNSMVSIPTREWVLKSGYLLA